MQFGSSVDAFWMYYVFFTLLSLLTQCLFFNHCGTTKQININSKLSEPLWLKPLETNIIIYTFYRIQILQKKYGCHNGDIKRIWVMLSQSPGE